MKATLFVLPGGSVVGRHLDTIEMFKLGLLPTEARRATKVEFNPDQRRWEMKTLTDKHILSGLTRRYCLEEEARFLDRILSQFFMCRQEDGRFLCPDCQWDLGDKIYINCPVCGYGFPNFMPDLEWRDFDLDYLVR